MILPSLNCEKASQTGSWIALHGTCAVFLFVQYRAQHKESDKKKLDTVLERGVTLVVVPVSNAGTTNSASDSLRETLCIERGKYAPY